MDTGTTCCGGKPATSADWLETSGLPCVDGFVAAGVRMIPAVATRLSRRDILGGWMMRWDIGRKAYRVPPGLYAVGKPVQASPVLVTANYKFTFDSLRRELFGIDAWIVVLDTKGINVWCAAGKGTFGTQELVDRIAALRLNEIVSHRKLILPQLGAPGVSAPEVKQRTGYQVVYGPVRALDLPAFLAAGMRKSERMRRVEFRLADRLAVAPVELRQAWKFLAGLAILAGLLALPIDAGYGPRLLNIFLPFLGSILVGTVVFPALLPFLPFRAFSLKGAVLGLVWCAAAACLFQTSLLSAIAFILTAVPLVAFLAMNFTGASTFTCQAGAELEVANGAIPMAVSFMLGLGLNATARFMGV
jgi:hypothetical protein